MINAVRNLIINKDPNTFRSQELGYEYMPPNFVPKAVPSNIANAKNILFGSQPEGMFMNARWRQIAPLIHNNTFQPYIDALDSRCTYYPFNNDDFFENLGTIKTEILISFAAGLHPLDFLGAPKADEAKGWMYYAYRFLQSDSSTSIEDYHRNEDYDYSYASVLPEGPIPVMDLYGPQVQFSTRYIDLTFTVRKVEMWGKFETPFSTILTRFENALTSSGGLAWLFPEPRVEPYSTFYNLYNEAPTDNIKYGALFMALAYRTNEMDQN